MKILKTAKYIKKAQPKGRYEIVHSEEGEHAKPIIDSLLQDEKIAVEQIFDKWILLHEQDRNPDLTNNIMKHETDVIKKSGPYVVAYNTRLGYVGLFYDTLHSRGIPPGFEDERDFSGDYDPYAGTGWDEPPGSY
jgi:hypothetical protein